MISLFTKTLQEYIDNGGNVYPEKFAQIPQFVFNDIKYSAYDIFLRKYKLREIGAETDELFAEYLAIKLDEVIIKYAQKIQMYIDNFGNAFERFSNLERVTEINKEINGTYAKTGTIHTDDNTSINNSEKTYLNPIVTDNAKLQDKTDSNTQNIENKTDAYNLTDTEQKVDKDNKTEKYQQLHTIFKSNTQLLEESMKIQSIYYEMIESFSVLFMGVY